jgi:secreted trypsin-like serine protease
MNLRRALTIWGLATAMVSGSALAASAVTSGASDGDGHPNVGMIGYYDTAGRERCSATLVSPTVVLTAAHCTDGTLGKTAVKFDSVIADQPSSSLPPAADPSTGYTSEELAAYGWLSGTAHAHPAYSHLKDKDSWNDVGVVVLDQPVTGITPVQLAPLGYLDQFTPSLLHQTLFTAVGYGVDVTRADAGSQKPTPASYPILRQVVEAPGQKLTSQILQVNGSANDSRGTGGTCFGDSGGPAFVGDYQVSVTSYGYGSTCQSIDGFQRVDIAAVQDWLAGFGIYPSS